METNITDHFIYVREKDEGGIIKQLNEKEFTD